MQEKIFSIIKKPVISEKSTALAEVANRYVFKVDVTASKTEIKAAIESLFKVKVKGVNTIVRKGKLRTFRGIRALLSDTKRAVVTLEDGHSIDVTTGL